MIDKIGKDKLLHFAVSAIGAAFLKTMLIVCECGAPDCYIVSAAMMLAYGVAKEVYDKLSGKGSFEWADLFADILGIFVGIL